MNGAPTGPPLIVLKLGGAVTEHPLALAEDIARVRRGGVRLVLVHGGSTDIDLVCEQSGLPRRRIEGPGGVSGRYADPATLTAVITALCGRVKPRLLSALAAAGVPAHGLTGLDNGLIRARVKPPFRGRVDGRATVVRDDRSGRIRSVDAAPLHRLLADGIVPVLSPPALTEDGPVNVDADRTAVAVARALGADRLVLLSNVEGVRARADDPATLIPRLSLPRDGTLPFTGGGMGAKLSAAWEAATAGIQVRLADGRTPAPLSGALDGAGTHIVLSEHLSEPQHDFTEEDDHGDRERAGR